MIRQHRNIRRIALLAAAGVFIGGCGEDAPAIDAASGGDEETAAKNERVALKRVRLADPEHGRALFVDKGCVICHAVNGVGGKAAQPLDAPVGAGLTDPLDFAARMWRGAPAMIELQSVELGYTIQLTADEIADLAAFHADRDAQKALTEASLPENIRNGLLDEQFWEMEDWEDFLRHGREGMAPPPDGVEIEELPVDPQ